MAVSRLWGGKSVETILLDERLAEGVEPLRWRDVAARMPGLVDDLTAHPLSMLHDGREAALRCVWPAEYPASEVPGAENKYPSGEAFNYPQVTGVQAWRPT